MGISGCTSCQAGGVEALKAYDQAFQLRRDNEARENSKALEAQQLQRNQDYAENRPVADGTVGSIINISA